MADIRCPMCGKPNPQTAEACAFCGARLTPTRADSKQEPARPSTPPAGADWMSDLRVDILRNRPKTGMLPPEPESPSDTGNWLSRLGPGEQKGGSPDPASGPDAEPGQPPDWLMRVRDQSGQSVPNKPRTSGNMEQKGASPSNAMPPPNRQADSSSSGPVTEVPSWLSKVRDQVDASNAEPARPQKPAGQASKNIGQAQKPPIKNSPAQVSSPSKADEEPTWLKRVRTRKVTEEFKAPPPSSSAEPEAVVEQSNELPSWLSKLRDKSPDELSGADPSSILSTPSYSASPGTNSLGGKAETDSALPDWLKQMAGSNEPASPPPPSLSEPNESQGVPDWLAGADRSSGQSAPAFNQSIPPAAASKPDWLAGADAPSSSLRSPAFESAFPTSESPASPFDQDFSLGQNSAQGQSDEANPPGWDFPDADLNPTFSRAASSSPASASAFSAGMEPIVSPSGRSESPDWLESARQEATIPSGAQNTAAEEPPMPSGPSLQELLQPDSIPNWLTKPAEASELADSQSASPEIAAPISSDGIEHAELPRWLEAMRPIQAVQVSEEDERVESVGPLAGLRGVITAEPVIAMPRRPRILAGNIDATPQQTARAEMLQRMVIETEWRGPRRAGPRSIWEPLLRRLIALALILSVVIPLFGISMFGRPAPQDAVPVVRGFAETVNHADARRPALLAVEYDPSVAPEMTIGAEVVIAQLVQKNIPFAIISTEPAGPTLGELLLTRLETTAIADFGYLPGGASGIRSLVDAKDTAPANEKFRSRLSVSPAAWKNEPLSSVHSFGDFSLIIVIANKPQTVRDWVEQVHTSYSSVPMLVVTSAAADALVFPYTQGSAAMPPQLAGLVSGYVGAESYRSYAQAKQYLTGGQPSVESDFRWQAFGMSGALAGAVLLCGMVASLIVLGLRGSRGRRNANR
jgi:hypothetical protein